MDRDSEKYTRSNGELGKEPLEHDEKEAVIKEGSKGSREWTQEEPKLAIGGLHKEQDHGNGTE